MNKTKIVATYGPALAHADVLQAVLSAGADVIRLNFSHGTLAEKATALAAVRQAADRAGRVVAVMGDLCGQKIRLGPLAGGRMQVLAGDTLRLCRECALGEGLRVGTNYRHLVDDVAVGHRILIDDGALQFTVEAKHADELHARCLVGGTLTDRKGINLPDSQIAAPSLTEKDFIDLEWILANELDYVSVSFVRRPEDVQAVRARIRAAGSRLRIITKIEKPEALEHLDRLIELSDAIMVARGDLGVEMDLAKVPLVQKDITRRCTRQGKPCIIATQMLQSMVSSPAPTRAEVSDVANAVFDCADAVMLSAETAVGANPVAAVALMNRIGQYTEEYLARTDHLHEDVHEADLPATSSVAAGVCRLAGELQARLVAVWTLAGNTVRLLSKHRLDMPVVGLSPDARTCRQMALHYGVIPVQAARPANLVELVNQTNARVLDLGLAAHGDVVVICAPQPLRRPGSASVVFVHRVGPYAEDPEAAWGPPAQGQAGGER